MFELKNKPFVITICSGKGGVGKSILSANIALALSENDISVLLWDGDMYFPNQHFILGVEPPVRLRVVYSGMIGVQNAIFNINNNLSILADLPASGKKEALDSSTLDGIFTDIIVQNDFDIIIIDTPAAGSEELLQFCSYADLICMIITDEPTSLLDAYGLVKILMQYFGSDSMALLANNVIDADDAGEITKKLNLATDKFLNSKLDVLGYIPWDRVVRQSIMLQEPFVAAQPDSEAAKAVKKVTEKLIEKIFVFE